MTWVSAGVGAAGVVGGLLTSKDQPSTPHYGKLARQQAGLDQTMARTTASANRPDLITPGSTTTWEQGTGFDQAGWDAAQADYQAKMADPKTKKKRYLVAPTRSDYVTGDPDRWTGTQTLTPEGQRAFESSQRMQTGLSGLGERAVGAAQGIFDTPYTTPGETPGYTGPEGELGTFGENRQRVTDAMLSRVDTDIGRDRESKSAELISRGIPIGSEAYQREMEQLDRKQTDARQQAEIAATRQATQEYGADIAGRGQMGREGMADFTTGMDIHQQNVSDALLERSTPLNEISSLRSGAQVNLPSMPQYGQQQFTGGPDVMGAAQQGYAADIGNYNVDQAQMNNLWGGLVDIGAGIGASGGFGGFGGGGGVPQGVPTGNYTSPTMPLGWY